jgi:hypothetical protein
VTLHCPAPERVQFFAEVNHRLRADGLIVAWRDETYGVHALDSGHLLATFERAASRFWGTTTFGAHCNGYVVGADGKGIQQITSGAGDNEDPAWSPDGHYLVFSSTRTGRSELWLSTADGRHQSRITQGGGWFQPMFAPGVR